MYNDGASATHFQVFPANAGPGWFSVTSFDVGTPGHVVANLFNDAAQWQSTANYYGVNSQAFGFYIDAGAAVAGTQSKQQLRPTSLVSNYSEDDENPGVVAMNLVFPATGNSVGSWWLAFQATSGIDGYEFTDALVFLESVNLTSPVQPITWGGIKSLYAP